MSDAPRLLCVRCGYVAARPPDGAPPACPECGAGLLEANINLSVVRPIGGRKPDPRRRHAGPDRRRQEPQ